MGVAPSARSTPTLWAYAQRNAHKDTPKKIPSFISTLTILYYELERIKIIVNAIYTK
ncbi:MAG: hypothetical protein RML94_01190 [Bacteroidia bacterium]|nr:hypothetical protein [Bacteroidia bacterium]